MAANKNKPEPKEKKRVKLSATVHPAFQQRSQEKRDRLIRAGIRIFAEKGYDQTRVADLAKAADISVGVFYQRFKDKRGFFNALEIEFVERGKRNWDRYFEAAEQQQASAQEIMESLVSSLARLTSRNIGFMRALISVGHHDKNVISPVVEMDMYGAAKLEAFLIERKLITKGKLRPEQVYFGLSSITRSLAVMSLTNAGPHYANDKQTISELAHMLGSYLGLRDKK